jgi:hypothetical protein
VAGYATEYSFNGTSLQTIENLSRKMNLQEAIALEIKIELDL